MNMSKVKYRLYSKENDIMYDWEEILSFDSLKETLMGGDVESKYYSPLLQSTGLTDKNGVEIYAGDVYDIGICTKTIRHDHYIEDTKELKEMIQDNAVLEVIGNIYKNRELV